MWRARRLVAGPCGPVTGKWMVLCGDDDGEDEEEEDEDDDDDDDDDPQRTTQVRVRRGQAPTHKQAWGHVRF